MTYLVKKDIIFNSALVGRYVSFQEGNNLLIAKQQWQISITCITGVDTWEDALDTHGGATRLGVRLIIQHAAVISSTMFFLTLPLSLPLPKKKQKKKQNNH